VFDVVEAQLPAGHGDQWRREKLPTVLVP
jgi:hypothetical protein